SPAADELFGASSVDRAPAAPLAARGEADHVALLVQGAPNPIDPPETEGLVDRFRPGDAGSPRALLIEADPQLSRGVVVLSQPPSKIIRGRKEGRVHGRALRETTRGGCANRPGVVSDRVALSAGSPIHRRLYTPSEAATGPCAHRTAGPAPHRGTGADPARVRRIDARRAG